MPTPMEVAEQVAPLCDRCRGKRVHFGKACARCKGEGRINLAQIAAAVDEERQRALDAIYLIQLKAQEVRRAIEAGEQPSVPTD